jgi:transcription-repair coupling factor (superfamily II helicase)
LPPRPVERGTPPLLFYPEWEVLPHESRLPHVDVVSERLETLVALCHPSLDQPSTPKSGEPPLIVTSVVALLQRTFPPTTLQASLRKVQRGQRLDPLDLVEALELQGYQPEAQVTQKGEIALRGGILDVFAPTNPWPVRLEFVGNEIESLRHFDPLTQISREEIASALLPPAGELGLLKKASSEPDLAGSVPARPGVSRGLSSLVDYLPPQTLWLLCEPEHIDLRAGEYSSQVPDRDPFHITWQEFREAAGAKDMTFIEVSESPAWPIAGGAAILPSRLDNTAEPCSSESACSKRPARPIEGTPRFEGLDAFRPITDRPPEPEVAEAQRREFFAQMHRWLRQQYSVHVFCNNDGERLRFLEIWDEYGLSLGAPDAGTGVVPNSFRPSTHLGALDRGFIFEEARLIVVTDAEIFGRYKVQRPRRLKSPHAQVARSALDIDFAELEDGDYVVHLQHGIGKYLGLAVIPTGIGSKPLDSRGVVAADGQECLVLEFSPADPSQPPPKLYVPVTEAHLVSKYVGSGKARPPLNRLGGTRWAKAKQHAERAVRDIAADLLSIQAARESQPGHAFGPDAPWQREFESAFIYEETPDQVGAITATKADMERPKPMDRLICGDVGFGKTEVAIRAAFKAVMGGKQVAVLVPTTVLAQQHYNTFRERMADYPVRIELLSRFRTRRAQERVARDLAGGSVDIVIGTHRLLQDDIAFKDLGLVVIDEEQRFGVLHKEKFKLLRKLVDVLTLSATPIPRTLYLALTGARDMSTIQTPPHDRLPVETIVAQYDERLIRDAIRRELNRGGQVFFLHNRVMTIDAIEQKLKQLIPDARIVVGHGQMHSRDLEEVMTRFVNGEADILLSTTIIESGLDIPNANTIIIDRADRFGLSDLYQLRGRVGRYKHQAYAYLLLPRHAGLLADVRKRISAMKQYSTLGSGFKIAMRDLEIRGAGNLLGAEQSGHITAVGFELYCQLLKQSITTLKGGKVPRQVEVKTRLDFLSLNPADESVPPEAASPWPASACIPLNYVSDSSQRIEIYRKLAQCGDLPALAALKRELRDRFGPIPHPVERLLKVAELKLLAAARGITAIEVETQKVKLTRNNDFIMVGSKFPRLTKLDPEGRLRELRQLLLAL